jgi:hypothetical protein
MIQALKYFLPEVMDESAQRTEDDGDILAFGEFFAQRAAIPANRRCRGIERTTLAS